MLRQRDIMLTLLKIISNMGFISPNTNPFARRTLTIICPITKKYADIENYLVTHLSLYEQFTLLQLADRFLRPDATIAYTFDITFQQKEHRKIKTLTGEYLNYIMDEIIKRINQGDFGRVETLDK